MLVHILGSDYTVILLEVKVINIAAADCFDFYYFENPRSMNRVVMNWCSTHWHQLEKNFILYSRNFHDNLKILKKPQNA